MDGETKKCEPKSAAELNDLLSRAHNGDETCFADLRTAFDENPELATSLGDLVQHAKNSLLTLLADKSILAREAISRAADDLREQLMATAHNKLERLLVDRIVLCWLAIHQAEMCVANLQLERVGPVLHRDAQRRLDGAHRRYLSAIKSLATIQKLLRPVPSAYDVLTRPRTDEKAGVANPLERSCRIGNGEPVLN